MHVSFPLFPHFFFHIFLLLYFFLFAFLNVIPPTSFLLRGLFPNVTASIHVAFCFFQISCLPANSCSPDHLFLNALLFCCLCRKMGSCCVTCFPFRPAGSHVCSLSAAACIPHKGWDHWPFPWFVCGVLLTYPSLLEKCGTKALCSLKTCISTSWMDSSIAACHVKRQRALPASSLG